MKRRVVEGDILVGKPLDCDIHDENNNLLLKKGYVVATRSQIDLLLSRGVYFVSNHVPSRQSRPYREAADADDGRHSRSSFELIEQAYADLEKLYIRDGNPKNLAHIVDHLSRLIQQACDQDKDASLSTILWPCEIKYSIKHSVDAAIACEIILKRLGYAPEDRLSVLAAGLTMNIAMIELQDTLFYQKEQLSEDQRKNVQNHVLRGVEIIGDHGVEDESWLTVVLQHHEFLDGSGYPNGLKGDEIVETARILTIADIYCAKVSGRFYRNPLPPTKAMGEVYCKDRGHCIDPLLAREFALEFGIYPPGSIVRLANGDIAVVIRTGAKIDQPVACSIIRHDGTAYLNPKRRDCSGEQLLVKEFFFQSDRSSLNRYRLWGIGEKA